MHSNLKVDARHHSYVKQILCCWMQIQVNSNMIRKNGLADRAFLLQPISCLSTQSIKNRRNFTVVFQSYGFSLFYLYSLLYFYESSFISFLFSSFEMCVEEIYILDVDSPRRSQCLSPTDHFLRPLLETTSLSLSKGKYS